jgi:hypothetical protein
VGPYRVYNWRCEELADKVGVWLVFTWEEWGEMTAELYEGSLEMCCEGGGYSLLYGSLSKCGTTLCGVVAKCPIVGLVG